MQSKYLGEIQVLALRKGVVFICSSSYVLSQDLRSYVWRFNSLTKFECIKDPPTFYIMHFLNFSIYFLFFIH